MSRIAETFARLKTSGPMAFMPFITAGDPDLSVTGRTITELAKQGVDLIEIGFPYSDPIADGPVIQASYNRALQAKLQVGDILKAIAALPTATLPPLVAMVSYAIIFRHGGRKFAEAAAKAGFAGMIVPDLPTEEATDLSAVCRELGLDLIQLIAPTTTPERTRRILETATGFIYCISVAGTTGARTELPAELQQQLRWLKSQTQVPLAVGFGISRPEQVAALRGLADGIIVGSALVRKLAAITEEGVPVEQALATAGAFAAEMVQATRAS